MAVDFWIANLSQDRLNALEARWSSPLTRAQLNNPWQAVKIDGVAVPGLCMLRKVKRKLKFQQNKASGSDGGTATIRGLENPQFDLEVLLFTPSHLSAWLKIAKSLDLFGNPSERSQHLIEHPLCQLSGVKAVIALEIEYRTPEAGGPLSIILGLLGYGEKAGATKLPAKKTVPTAAPSVPIEPQKSPQSLQQYIRPPGAAR